MEDEVALRMDDNLAPDAELDCVGLFCPLPIARTKEEIENIEIGQVLKVEADDPAAEEDIARWAKRAGHEMVRLEKSGNRIIFWIRRKK
jgi:tRNA 2-thiouridine synthesizing protein A